jgi:hypothetical protein
MLSVVSLFSDNFIHIGACGREILILDLEIEPCVDHAGTVAVPTTCLRLD